MESTSVVVFGKVKLVTEKNIFEDRLRKLAAKYYPNIDEIEKKWSILQHGTAVCHKNRTHDGQTRQRKNNIQATSNCFVRGNIKEAM